MNLHRIEKGGQSNFEYKSFVPEKNLVILPLSVKDVSQSPVDETKHR